MKENLLILLFLFIFYSGVNVYANTNPVKYSEVCRVSNGNHTTYLKSYLIIILTFVLGTTDGNSLGEWNDNMLIK